MCPWLLRWGVSTRGSWEWVEAAAEVAWRCPSACMYACVCVCVRVCVCVSVCVHGSVNPVHGHVWGERVPVTPIAVC